MIFSSFFFLLFYVLFTIILVVVLLLLCYFSVLILSVFFTFSFLSLLLNFYFSISFYYTYNPMHRQCTTSYTSIRHFHFHFSIFVYIHTGLLVLPVQGKIVKTAWHHHPPHCKKNKNAEHRTKFVCLQN